MCAACTPSCWQQPLSKDLFTQWSLQRFTDLLHHTSTTAGMHSTRPIIAGTATSFAISILAALATAASFCSTALSTASFALITSSGASHAVAATPTADTRATARRSVVRLAELPRPQDGGAAL